MTLIVSAIVLLLLIIALLLFYRSGVRGTGQAPQVVGAPVGQTKSAPPPESAAPAAGNGLQIYKSEVTPSYEGKQPNFTPAPEQPAPRPAPSAPVTSAPVASAPVTAAPLRPAQTEPTAPPPP
ncbi:MAG: SPOR domain-containing protein, partial [Caulobacteraceae bacterium]|nr:SPOR domain-containing protein [Caulobacteraceae bacterium]